MYKMTFIVKLLQHTRIAPYHVTLKCLNDERIFAAIVNLTCNAGVPFAGNTKACIFWDSFRIVLIDFIVKEITVITT